MKIPASFRPNAVHALVVLIVPAAIAASDTSVPSAGNPNPPDFYGPRTSGGAYRSWRNARIDGGGFVTGMVASPLPNGPLYARTDVGGAYRWLDSTSTWLPITDNMEGTRQIESMAADPADPNVVYIAAGGRVFRSVNQGASWTSGQVGAWMAGNNNGRCVGERLSVDPAHPATLMFGSRRDGLFRSDDSGSTWQKVGGFTDWKGDAGITFVIFEKRGASPGMGGRKIYVGTQGNKANLYASGDDGKSWQAVPGQPTGLFPNHAVISPSGVLYLAYANGCGPADMSDGAVWRYDGRAWTGISPVDPRKGSGDFFGYGSIALDPKDPNTLVVGSMDRWNWGDSLWRTRHADAPVPDWEPLFGGKVKPKWISPAPYKGRDSHWISDIEFNPARPGQLFFAFGQGVQRTDNVGAGQGAIWTFSAQGLEETVVLSMASPTQGPPLLSGLGDIGGFAHPDLASSPPVRHSTGNTTGLDFAALAPSIMARVGSGPGKYSHDGGATWIPFATAPPGKLGSVALSADGKTCLVTADGVAHCSRDLGNSWKPCANLPKGAKIASDRVNPGRFYAYVNLTGAVFTSADGGAAFTASTTKLPGTYGYLHSAIIAVPGFEGHVYLSTQNTGMLSGFYKSTDAGLTFTPVSGFHNNSKPLTANNSVKAINTFGFGKGLPGRRYPALYVAGIINLPTTGETNGVFRSDDGGTSWIHINDDRHRFETGVIAGDGRTPGRVYLGTSGRGIVYGDP